MQTPETTAPRRQRRRPQISCTECRRRKQKCNPRKDGPCANCLRRYPPVPCFVQELDEPKSNRSAIRQEGSQNELTSKAADLTGGFRGVTLPSLNNFNPFSYPAIPLSRILHPADSSYQHPEAALAVRTANNVNLSDEGSKPVNPDHESKDKLQLESIRKRLEQQQQQSGLQEYLLKRSGSPRAVGGILSMLNAFNAAPIEPNNRNTELLYYYHDYVAPTFCSVDGGNIPPVFAAHCLPWMMNSPLMPNVVILMASAAQSYAGTVAKSETLLLKSQVLSQVNKYIQKDFYTVANQALRIVIHLVVQELFWGFSDSIWPHMQGIKLMLKLRGGLETLDDALNYNVLIVTDYELACAFERELDFQSMENAIATVLSTSEWVPELNRSPLLPYPTSFQECRGSLNLSGVAAEILDDVKFLTTSITSCFLSPELKQTKTSKIQSTAAWLHKRIEDIPELTIVSITPISDIIIDAIRLCALVYTSAIKSLTPLSQNFPPELQERLFSNISLVGLKNWKDVPGIFLWILLVATPCSKDDHRGRFLRKQMACTGMTIGMDDFHLGTAYLRAFWLVQRWIAREGLNAVDADANLDAVRSS
ncbi:hypothetical protein BKA65DRAFT_103220 [Rhexocercosporidium sp. MPI-PUGE-AT-0058]|nr:hypothetical protein BKA65DRAFT_103220 [Rhexocercosporidium sp. MPI-PUGE-AT-0058]